MRELLEFRTKWKQKLEDVTVHKYLSDGGGFITEMQVVHIKLFGNKFIHNCPSCVIQAATRIVNYVIEQPKQKKK